MAVEEYDNINFPIRIVQGNIFSLNFAVTEEIATVQTPINITGKTVSGFIRAKRSDTTNLVSFTGSIVDGPNGTANISLTPTQTAALPLGGLYYQVDLVTSGNPFTYMAGPFFVR